VSKVFEIPTHERRRELRLAIIDEGNRRFLTAEAQSSAEIALRMEFGVQASACPAREIMLFTAPRSAEVALRRGRVL
jgi:hypothetical protein